MLLVAFPVFPNSGISGPLRFRGTKWLVHSTPGGGRGQGVSTGYL